MTRFSSDTIMMIDRYVFRADATTGADIFKIANLRASPTFFSARAVQAWSDAGLHGLVFTKLWSE